MPTRFIHSKSSLMPSLVMLPFIQCHHTRGLAEFGGFSKPLFNGSAAFCANAILATRAIARMPLAAHTFLHHRTGARFFISSYLRDPLMCCVRFSAALNPNAVLVSGDIGSTQSNYLFPVGGGKICASSQCSFTSCRFFWHCAEEAFSAAQKFYPCGQRIVNRKLISYVNYARKEPAGASDPGFLRHFGVDAFYEPGGVGIGPIRMLRLELGADLFSGVAVRYALTL